ncbi:hypothetical protein NC652_019860 [Populus alba x Populus x berolinensis]|nr:hypothetical protein NC652_019860 [Populus alba x Populus x berolinensis]
MTLKTYNRTEKRSRRRSEERSNRTKNEDLICLARIERSRRRTKQLTIDLCEKVSSSYFCVSSLAAIQVHTSGFFNRFRKRRNLSPQDIELQDRQHSRQQVRTPSGSISSTPRITKKKRRRLFPYDSYTQGNIINLLNVSSCPATTVSTNLGSELGEEEHGSTLILTKHGRSCHN